MSRGLWLGRHRVIRFPLGFFGRNSRKECRRTIGSYADQGTRYAANTRKFSISGEGEWCDLGASPVKAGAENKFRRGRHFSHSNHKISLFALLKVPTNNCSKFKFIHEYNNYDFYLLPSTYTNTLRFRGKGKMY